MTECLILISSGKGPRECEWVVEQLAGTILADALKAGVSAVVMDSEDMAASCLIKLSGKLSRDFITPYLGTVRWIGQSPFRPNHKRKNWFVGVSLMPDPEDVPSFRESDISYQTMKAGGPGGQHVNTTDSAVRATHGPTGLSVVAREERSQHANKRLAQVKIAALLRDRVAAGQAAGQAEEWARHQDLERGNEVRIYEGPKFKLKKA